MPKHRTRSREAREHCTRRTSKLSSRLGVGPAFQAAQYERRSILGRQPIHFALYYQALVAPKRLIKYCCIVTIAAIERPKAPPSRGPDAAGCTLRYPIEPTGNGLAAPNGTRRLGQCQKSRLAGVFGIVESAQHAAANAENHRAVPANEQLKCRFIPACGEASQQLIVGKTAQPARVDHFAELIHE
jgi:hypothetical protein